MNYKVVAITGASSGIGKATALKLGKLGIKLILIARRKDKLVEISEALKGDTVCHLINCDITDHDAITRQIEQLPEAFSQVDVLVNNAGLALGLGTAQESNWADWQRMISVNCTSLAFLTHALLPGMVDRNIGHIVNMGSIAGTYPYRGGNIYGATKAFVAQFTLNLKSDLLGTAVKVSNIEPGMVSESEFSLVRFKGDEQKATSVYDGIDALRPEDVAESIVWVLSQPSRVNVNRVEIMPVCQAPARTNYSKDLAD